MLNMLFIQQLLRYSYPTIHFARFALLLEALGIPFRCLGAAEINTEYQNIIEINDDGHNIDHIFYSLEDMLDGKRKPCCYHKDNSMGCAIDRDVEVSLAVTGSPCNPYSTQRSKRFFDGSVVGHHLNDTTMESVVSLYNQYEPHVGITEQVRGFNMVYSGNCTTTPMEVFLSLFFGFW